MNLKRTIISQRAGLYLLALPVAVVWIVLLASCGAGQTQQEQPSDLEAFEKLTVYPEKAMLEGIEVLREKAAAATGKYCVGEVVEAYGYGPRWRRCTDSDCRQQWVDANNPKKITKFCEENVCPLNDTDLYPITCGNLLFNRCQVRVGNISECR